MDLPKRIYQGREVDRLYRDLLRASGGGEALEYPGDPSLFLNGEGDFVAPPSGEIGVFMPDAAPATPHGSDDEGNDSVLTGWTSHHDIGTWSVDTVRKRLQASVTHSGDSQAGILVKDIPDSEFSCISKVGQLILTQGARVFDAGIVVAQGTGANDNFMLLSSYQFRSAVTGLTTVYGVRALHFSDKTTIVGGADLFAEQDQRSYLRIAVNGAAITLYTSVDGQNWQFAYATATLGWTPTKVGLGMWGDGSFGTGVVAKAHWDYIRFASGAGSSAYDGHIIGRYV